VKTISLKKVSAVAVASLGFGLLSVVPANAAITQTATITGVTGAIADGTATAAGVSVVYAAGSAVTATINVATATTMSNAADFIGADVAVTGPSLAAPASTTAVVASTVTAGATTATLIPSSPAAGELKGMWVSTSLTTAQALGTVTFTPARPGVYTITATPKLAKIGNVADTGATLTPATFLVSVGSDSVLAPTVGTSITANNAAIGQSAGQTAYRFTPAGFSKGASTVTSYFATVDAGSIDSITNGAVLGTAGTQTMTNALTNGVNNSGGYKLISTISGATWNAGGAQGVAASSWDITLSAGTATSQTLTIKQLNATTGAITTVATAVSTYGAAPVVSAGQSTSFIGAGTGLITVDAALVVSKTAGTVGNVTINIKDQYGVALGGQTISATIAGSGLILAETNDNTAPAGTARATSVVLAAGVSAAQIGINSDGTEGSATITITVGTTVIATETLKFFGTVKTLTAKQNHVIASKAGAALGDGTATPAGTSIATTPAVILTAKDASGNPVPSLTITAVSSDATVMSETLTINGDAGTALGNGAGAGSYNVAVTSVANTSGKTATLTFRVMSGTTVLATTTALTYTLGGVVDTVSLALDKASYSAGSAAVATLTVKDSSGNAAFDGDHAGILSGALATSLSVTKTLQFNATTNTVVSSLGGKSVVSFNAPATAVAAWNVTGTTGTGPGTDIAKALSATATVTDATAALVTMIDALNAKIVALNALIAKIMKKLGVK
jgi:hypothetical protein